MTTGDTMEDPLAPPEGYGVKPGQPEPQAVPEHCQHQGGGCMHPVAYAKWIGDINEHVWPLYLCWCCEIEVGRIGLGRCTVCKAQAHVVRTEVVPDPPRECGNAVSRLQSVLDWAGLNPAGGGRFA